MRYPVTFKQGDLDKIIKKWILDNYGPVEESHLIEKTYGYDNKDPNEVFNKRVEFTFSHSTWFGMVIDTLITIQECTQVFKAHTVTMQSQTRLGFKDYGYNYRVSDALYSNLNVTVTGEGKKSFISCT